MKLDAKELEVNGVLYVPKSDIKQQAESVAGLTLCVIRTYSAGIWYGLVDYDADDTFSNVVVRKARRIWKWTKAFSLSEISVNGIGSDSKIAIELTEVKLNRVIELLPVSTSAQKIIDSIKTYEV